MRSYKSVLFALSCFVLVKHCLAEFCLDISENHWKLFDEIFGSVNYVKVVNIFKTTDRLSIYKDALLPRFFRFLQKPILQLALSVEEEDTEYAYAELFSWQGEKYELRPNQKNSLIVNETKKSEQMPANENNFGVLVLSRQLSSLEEFITGSPRRPFHTPRGSFILIFLEDIFSLENLPILKRILLKLWQNYGMIKVTAISACSKDKILQYYPYAKSSSNEQWGDFVFINSTELEQKQLRDDMKNIKTLNGYPLTISMFQRVPTSMYWDELPIHFVNSYFCDAKKYSTVFGGFDGLVLGNLMQHLNFTMKLITPANSQGFGFKLDNGTFVGALGHIVYSKAAISFNSRFLTTLENSEIEFTFPVYFDQFCVVAPKASEIPQWLAIFRCYHMYTWMLIAFSNTSLGFLWLFFKRTSKSEYFQPLDRRSVEQKVNNCWYVLLIEMWIIMYSGPTTRLPRNSVERLFMTGCLLLSVIISGAFQGSLRTSYSTKSFYKDIQTLEDLDKSGLPIGTSSKSFLEIFGTTGENPVLESLQTKLQLVGKNSSTVNRAATKKDICGVERLSDISTIIITDYELADGTELLHVVKECPRTYFLGYLVRKGTPFSNRFNDVLARFIEGGFLATWYEQTEAAIILKTRLNRLKEVEVSSIALKLRDIQTAFYILILGVLISGFVFFFEYFECKRIKKFWMA